MHSKRINKALSTLLATVMTCSALMVPNVALADEEETAVIDDVEIADFVTGDEENDGDADVPADDSADDSADDALENDAPDATADDADSVPGADAPDSFDAPSTANTNTIELNTVYPFSEGDEFYFVPDEQAFYIFESVGMDGIVIEDIKSGDQMEDQSSFLNPNYAFWGHELPIVDTDMEQGYYYLEEGYTYKITAYDDVGVEDELRCFAMVKEAHYAYVSHEDKEYSTYPGGQVELSLSEVYSSIPYTSVSYEWVCMNESWTTEEPSTTVDIDAVLPGEHDEYESHTVYCLVHMMIGDMEADMYTYFDIGLYPSELESKVHTGIEDDEPEIYYGEDYWVENTVYAESDLDDCDISYQWYVMRDDEKVEIAGATSDVYSFNAPEIEPEVVLDEDGPRPTFHLRVTIGCLITFKRGNETVTRDESRDIRYSIFVGNFENYVGLNYGDTFEQENDFDDRFMLPSGFAIRTEWIERSTKEYVPDEDETVLAASGDHISISTSALTLQPGEEGPVSYVVSRPVFTYGGREYYEYDGGDVVYCIYYVDMMTPSGLALNETNFPDEIFRTYLSDSFDINKSGYLSESEIEAIDSIVCDGMGISDLTGINYLTNVEFLYCSCNNIDSLVLTDLDQLTELYLNNNNMTSLVLENCENLGYLAIDNNALASINLDGAPYIKKAYENGPHYSVVEGFSLYGRIEYDDNGNEEKYFPFLEIDDATVVENATPAELIEPAELSGRSLALEGYIKLRFYLILPDSFVENESAYVTLNDTEYNIADALCADGRYLFEYDLAAAQIQDRVVLRLWADDETLITLKDKNGNISMGWYPFSVDNYRGLVQSSTSMDAEKKRLLIDMLDYMMEYGKYAQAYFDYNDGNIDYHRGIASEIDSIDKGTLSSYIDSVSGVSGSGIEYRSSSLDLKSCTCLSVFFNLSGKSINDFTYWVDGQRVDLGSSGSDYSVGMDGDRVRLVIDNIKSGEIGRQYNIVVKNSQGQVVVQLNVSALGYAYKVLDKSSDDELRNLMKAMYLYYLAAKAYFG
ncbi:MAG: hypothetical protein K6A80_03675 [Saccharofermentans sp.]|nr:hypothetical protein [Saccharofermentans sp.]